ncbi:hypothetical protein GR168_12065 [Gordonia sp. JH63]|uniref:DUF6361 family protein n=1 Tax=Gordonia sp. JH63 TaxID=2698900 RepID=UPI00131FE3C2|nr:DUF6361 family protein [Gordonia sp. JH63]QHD86033.1 hypothetical protein GR168_12065 [Gordonia sp. JH63]
MSSLAWLDTSPDDERRMREIVKMFSDTSTLDDLGIGQVRDGLADLLFPGTSTVHARPRYFLIIPWIFERAAAKHTGTMVVSKANDEERKLIEVLRSPSPIRGMIGSRAGKTVQNLPSNIYWSALQRYQILTNAKALRWDVGVRAPADFPKLLAGGLDLTHDEAEWLRERIMVAAPGTYLAYLLANGLETEPDDAGQAWQHPALAIAPTDLRDTVEHARLFSLVVNGATLIYNLLIAERFDAVAADDGSWVEHYTERLTDWADEIERNRIELTKWDLDAFWATVLLGRNSNSVAPATMIFVNEWIGQVHNRDPYIMPADPDIRRMIAARERKNKGEQSRLNNERQIKNWGGSSGSARLNFRWPVVQTLLADIKDGLADAPA